MGKTAIVLAIATPYIILNPQLTLYRVSKDSLIDRHFLKYFFDSSIFQSFLLRISAISTISTLSLSAQKQLEIPFPSKPKQRAIASILGALDDKIDLNRRMNETLEAMARAIFKDWFVDFGPTRAKAEGRAPYLAPEIWALFPNRLDDEGKPEGWTLGKVSDIGQVICGKTPSTSVAEYYGHDVPFVTIPDMHGKIFAIKSAKTLSTSGAKSQPKKTLPVGSICVSCIATPGLVVMTTKPSQTNQQINSVVPSNVEETLYWFWVLRNLGEAIRQGGSGGSVLSNLSTGRFMELSILMSSQKTRFCYQNSVAPLFARILLNEKESETLTATRDLLLPKLMSGEIRVKDAEKVTEAVL
jgi:type I restriction enzyme, S subunit